MSYTCQSPHVPSYLTRRPPRGRPLVILSDRAGRSWLALTSFPYSSLSWRLQGNFVHLQKGFLSGNYWLEQPVRQSAASVVFLLANLLVPVPVSVPFFSSCVFLSLQLPLIPQPVIVGVCCALVCAGVRRSCPPEARLRDPMPSGGARGRP